MQMDNVLKRKVLFLENSQNNNNNNINNNNNNDKIIYYNETLCSYEQFDMIFKILMNSYVHFDSLKQAKEIVDYFGIDISNVIFEYPKLSEEERNEIEEENSSSSIYYDVDDKEHNYNSNKNDGKIMLF